MKPRSVVIALSVVVLLIVLAWAVRSGGGGAIARWLGSLHGSTGH